MTEAEWLNCADPTPMLEFLRGKASDRKLRLFAVACCRLVWNLFTAKRVKQAVEAAERFSDGFLPAVEMEKASYLAEDASNDAFHRGDSILCNAGGAAILSAQGIDVPHLHDSIPNIIVNAVESAEEAGLKTKSLMLKEIEKLLRDQLGNPFRPFPQLAPSVITWNDATVPRIAQGIYDERRLPEGTFDLGRLAILHDALLDAGCDNEELLTHLRCEGPHYRGCWAVDQILGKE